MSKKVEILAPAGSYDSLKAAIAAGADAVYVGGTRFGARAYADNLTEEQMLEAIDYVHLHGRKIYLTVNTLLKEREIEELYDYLLPYYKQGLDAVIVQDIGVLEFIKKHFPKLPIHASTQMTITNVLGASFLEKLGVERVVTARELSLEEIREISENTSLEIESFVHGALCYCYSGQCLYSSLIGGRSGNRGQCAQPCRLPYQVNGARESQYVLSLKDICTLEYIPELIESGIYSFKIEGRMKKPEYVALVTAMYRKYVDLYFEKGKKSFSVSLKDKEMLMDLYNRGGFHGGYYKTKNGKDMVSLERPNHAGVPVLKVVSQKGKQVTAKAIEDIGKGDVIELTDGKENFTFAEPTKAGGIVTFYTHQKQSISNGQILNRIRNEQLLQFVKEQFIDRKSKEKINGKLMLSTKEPTKLCLQYQDIYVEITGEVAQQAMNQPMDCERIEKQMRKTGNTPFEFETFDVLLDGKIFVPMQSLNELRRTGLELLKKKIVEAYRRSITHEPEIRIPTPTKREVLPSMHVYVERLEQLHIAIETRCIKRIYVDCNTFSNIWNNDSFLQYIEKAHQAEKEIYLGMPHIFRKETILKYEDCYETLFEAKWDGMLIRNYESYSFLKKHHYQKHIVTDYNLYQFNRYAKDFWIQQGVECTTAPLELHVKELEEVGLEQSELVVYGYFPMMVSAQCIKKTMEGCNRQKGEVVLKDRYQKTFSVKNLCDYCYNMIYNTLPVVLTDQVEDVIKLNPRAMRLHFTLEDAQSMKRVLNLYEDAFYIRVKNIEPDIEFTRGHFKRGIK